MMLMMMVKMMIMMELNGVFCVFFPCQGNQLDKPRLTADKYIHICVNIYLYLWEINLIWFDLIWTEVRTKIHILCELWDALSWVNDTRNSGGRWCKHIFDHQGWVKKMTRTKEIYINRGRSCGNNTKLEIEYGILEKTSGSNTVEMIMSFRRYHHSLLHQVQDVP